VVRYSPLRPGEICLEAIVGGEKFSPVLWASEVARVPANATRSELEAAMSAQSVARRRSAARIRELTSEDVPDVIGDLVASARSRGAESGRALIAATPGTTYMQVVDLRDEVRGAREGGERPRTGALSAPATLDVEQMPVEHEADGSAVYASRWEREMAERERAVSSG